MYTQPKLEDRTDLNYMGIRTQAALPELPTVIPQLLDEVMGWLQKQGAAPAGAPFIRYHVINMESKLDIELGWPVAKPLSGNERVKAGVIPAGRYATLIYTDVKNGMNGNKVLIDWATANGIKWDRWDDKNGDAFRSRVETFLTNPDDEPDMSKWQTEVAIKLVNGHQS
jgi:effector-binding domain-containing protein